MAFGSPSVSAFVLLRELSLTENWTSLGSGRLISLMSSVSFSPNVVYLSMAVGTIKDVLHNLIKCY